MCKTALKTAKMPQKPLQTRARQSSRVGGTGVKVWNRKVSAKAQLCIRLYLRLYYDYEYIKTLSPAARRKDNCNNKRALPADEFSNPRRAAGWSSTRVDCADSFRSSVPNPPVLLHCQLLSNVTPGNNSGVRQVGDVNLWQVLRRPGMQATNTCNHASAGRSKAALCAVILHPKWTAPSHNAQALPAATTHAHKKVTHALRDHASHTLHRYLPTPDQTYLVHHLRSLGLYHSLPRVLNLNLICTTSKELGPISQPATCVKLEFKPKLTWYSI